MGPPTTKSDLGKNTHKLKPTTTITLHTRLFLLFSSVTELSLPSTYSRYSPEGDEMQGRKAFSNSTFRIKRGGCERKEVKGGWKGREEILASVPTFCKSRFDTQAQKHWWFWIWRWLNLTFLSSTHVYTEYRGYIIHTKTDIYTYEYSCGSCACHSGSFRQWNNQ